MIEEIDILIWQGQIWNLLWARQMGKDCMYKRKVQWDLREHSLYPWECTDRKRGEVKWENSAVLVHQTSGKKDQRKHLESS